MTCWTRPAGPPGDDQPDGQAGVGSGGGERAGGGGQRVHEGH